MKMNQLFTAYYMDRTAVYEKALIISIHITRTT